MALIFKQALRRLRGGVDPYWKYAPVVKAMEAIPLDDASTEDLAELEWVCCAFLYAIRAGRYEKAGLVPDEPAKEDSPIWDWDHSYRLQDKFTNQAIHVAEVGWINERMLEELADMAKNRRDRGEQPQRPLRNTLGSLQCSSIRIE